MRSKIMFVFSIIIEVGLISSLLYSCATIMKGTASQIYPEDYEFEIIKPIKVKVDSSYWLDQPLSQYGAKPKARFLVVNLSFMNYSNTPKGFDRFTYSPYFQLSNNAGVQYTFEEDLLNTADLSRLNPNMPGKAQIVFDVPSDDYILIVYLLHYTGQSETTDYFEKKVVCRLALKPRNTK